MDRGKIVETLGLIPEGTFSVTDLQIVQWGRDVIFVCEYVTYQPDGTQDALVEFRMVFKDCRELRWKTYAHIAIAEVGEITHRTDIAEILLGHGNHRRDANILTSHFGATISYGQLVLEHEDGRFVISN